MNEHYFMTMSFFFVSVEFGFRMNEWIVWRWLLFRTVSLPAQNTYVCVDFSTARNLRWASHNTPPRPDVPASEVSLVDLVVEILTTSTTNGHFSAWLSLCDTPEYEYCLVWNIPGTVYSSNTTLSWQCRTMRGKSRSSLLAGGFRSKTAWSITCGFVL